MTELSTDRKIGIFAPSNYGKGWALHQILRQIPRDILLFIYDTDFEKDIGKPKFPYAYAELPNAVIFTPPATAEGEALGFLGEYIAQVLARTENRPGFDYRGAFIVIPGLDLFFMHGTAASFEASSLKNLASRGRHQRTGLIYDTKRTAFIPDDLVANTNLFYFGKLTLEGDKAKVKSYVTTEDLTRLDAQTHKFLRLDMLTGQKDVTDFNEI